MFLIIFTALFAAICVKYGRILFTQCRRKWVFFHKIAQYDAIAGIPDRQHF